METPVIRTKTAVLRRACGSPKSLSLIEVSFGHVSLLIASWSGWSWSRCWLVIGAVSQGLLLLGRPQSTSPANLVIHRCRQVVHGDPGVRLQQINKSASLSSETPCTCCHVPVPTKPIASNCISTPRKDLAVYCGERSPISRTRAERLPTDLLRRSFRIVV